MGWDLGQRFGGPRIHPTMKEKGERVVPGVGAGEADPDALAPRPRCR